VEQAGPESGKPLPELGEPGLRRRQVEGFAFLYEGADPVDPFPRFHPFLEEGKEPRDLLRRDRPGLHGFPSRGKLADDGDGKVAVDREGEGPGNGGGRHDENVGAPALGTEGVLLENAEPVLFVHDGYAHPGEGGFFGEQGMGPDGHGNFP